MSIWIGTVTVGRREYSIILNSETEHQIGGSLFDNEQQAQLFVEWLDGSESELLTDPNRRIDFLRREFVKELPTFKLFRDKFSGVLGSFRKQFIFYLDESEPGCDPFARTPDDMQAKIDAFFKRLEFDARIGPVKGDPANV